MLSTSTLSCFTSSAQGCKSLPPHHPPPRHMLRFRALRVRATNKAPLLVSLLLHYPSLLSYQSIEALLDECFCKRRGHTTIINIQRRHGGGVEHYIVCSEKIGSSKLLSYHPLARHPLAFQHLCFNSEQTSDRILVSLYCCFRFWALELEGIVRGIAKQP